MVGVCDDDLVWDFVFGLVGWVVFDGVCVVLFVVCIFDVFFE